MSEGESKRAIDKLIAIEWDIIRDMQRQLDSDVSNVDMVRISNSLAYHANTLSKLLAERSEKPDIKKAHIWFLIVSYIRPRSRPLRVCEFPPFSSSVSQLLIAN